MTLPSSALAVASAAAVLLAAAPVAGHGHLISPRSRNYVASQDGKSWFSPGDPTASVTPWRETCPHCLNMGGVCGTSSSSISGSLINYNDPPNALGGSMPTQIQATYKEGEIIELETVLTAHHKGHYLFKACKLDASNPSEPTQACFDANPLTFESDELYGAPKDTEYPGRAYIAPSGISTRLNGPSGMLFRHTFKLPNGLSGGRVLLQWHYITGNSCEDVGYKNNPWNSGGVLGTCPEPLPLTGVPEQFWNCAEIKIESAGGSLPPTRPSRPTGGRPTLTPPVPTRPSPTPPSPTPQVISPTEQITANMCGISWDDASKCGTPCPTGNATFCPSGEYCFADVNVSGCGGEKQPSPTPPAASTPTAATAAGNTNFCGMSWRKANSRCAIACPGGAPEECPTGQMCYAGCTSCTGSPVKATVPTPMPISAPMSLDPTSPGPTNAPFPAGFCDESHKMQVNVGFYQSWAVYRDDCFKPQPEDLDISGMQYTHLVYSFASIGASNTLEPYFGDYATEELMYTKFNALKAKHPKLKTLIAVGGWTHNDPGEATCHRFAKVSSTTANRQAFANSVVNFLVKYGFEGIDLDWEYPGDDARCGTLNDKANYSLLVEAIRTAFDEAGRGFLITMAIPASKYRLGEGYDLPGLAQNLDWFNIMTYDIAGTWSSTVGSHTDMQHIESTINYILSEGVPSYQLAMGLAAYGRTFTLSDPSCTEVGCGFNSAASGGCGGERGFAPLFNILETIETGDYKKLELNSQTGSMELVTNADEFVSFDNKESFQIKHDHAAAMCMRGYFWWAADMIVDGFTLEGGDAASDQPTAITTSSALSTTTTAATVNTDVGNKQHVIEAHAKCGGRGWTPPTSNTVCKPGHFCRDYSAWWSQCQPCAEWDGAAQEGAPCPQGEVLAAGAGDESRRLLLAKTARKEEWEGGAIGGGLR